MTLTRRSFLSRLAILAAAPVAVARAIAAPPKPRVWKDWGDGPPPHRVFQQEYQCAFWDDEEAARNRLVAWAGRQSGKTQTTRDFTAYFDAKYGKGRYRPVSWDELATHCGYSENGVYHPPTIS